MSRFILNPDKLKELPADFQAAVKLLTGTQLSKLQAAFSNYAFFDFLGLPLEIRLMIYRLLLHGEGSKVHHGKIGALPNLNLLVVNKQVNSEAKMILYEDKTCTLDWSRRRNILQHHRDALRTFRSFDMKIEVEAEYVDWYYELRISKFFCKIIAQLKAHHPVDARISLNIHFFPRSNILNRNLGGSCDLFNHDLSRVTTDDKYKIMFLRIQLQHFVESFRCSFAKSYANARIHVDTLQIPSGFEYERLNERHIRFKDTEGRRMGGVECLPAVNQICVHYVEPYTKETTLSSMKIPFVRWPSW